MCYLANLSPPTSNTECHVMRAYHAGESQMNCGDLDRRARLLYEVRGGSTVLVSYPIRLTAPHFSHLSPPGSQGVDLRIYFVYVGVYINATQTRVCLFRV